MNVLNPFVRQFLVGWITVLDSVPDIDMLGFLPDLLDGKYLFYYKQYCLLVFFFFGVIFPRELLAGSKLIKIFRFVQHVE